ncbi:hypothetical protein D6827_01320, partial [Candidatus Parcubacteria bacterium]
MSKIRKQIFLLIVFLLPWQIRFIWGAENIGGHTNEFAVYSIYLVQILLVALAMWELILWRDSQNKSNFGRGQFFALLLFAWIFFLWQWRAASEYGLVYINYLIASILLCVLGVYYKVRGSEILSYLTAGLIVPFLFGVYQVMNGWFPAISWLGIAARDAYRAGDSVFLLPSGSRILRAYGSFPHPNIFAGYLALVGLLSVVYRKQIKPILFYAAAGMAIIGLIITGSVAAWAAFLAAVIAYLHYPWFSKKNTLIVAVSVILFSIIFLLTFYVINWGGRSVIERAQFIIWWWQVFWPNNFLLGSGAGQYMQALAKTIFASWWLYQPVHNVFLLWLVEVGIIGVVLSVAFFIEIYKKLPWHRLSPAII